jgi:hypothetical protein
MAMLACASVRAEPLRVKPGLWETTTATEKKSSNQPTNLERLTPEQRAKVEKKLAERVKRETSTVQACLDEARVRSGEAFIGKTHQATCSRIIRTQTANDLIATVECIGENIMSGRIAMHASDPEHMNGTVEVTYGAPGRLQLQTNSKITGRWLKAECGSMTGKTAHGH